jgi:signal peptidase II
LRRVVLIAAAVALLDQLTKLLVAGCIDGQQSLVVIGGFFNLVNWSNTGAAWGIFQNYNLVLAVVSVVTIIALYVFRHSLQFHRTASAIALGLIAGGIIGNFIDRVRLGHVVDFLDFYTNAEPVASWLQRYMGSNHWPAFNVADSAICVGVALYMIGSWRSDPDAEAAGANVNAS